MKITEISQEEFKKEIYKRYKQDFPKVERLPFNLIKQEQEQKYLIIMKGQEEEKIVGYAIVIEEAGYLLIHYIATYKEEREKGYGSGLLQEIYNKYVHLKGIVIEVERTGFGKNEQENQEREKSVSFYKRNGFEEINLIANIWNIEYEIYVQKTSEIANELLAEEIKKVEEKVYNRLLGEKTTQKRLKMRNKY